MHELYRCRFGYRILPVNVDIGVDGLQRLRLKRRSVAFFSTAAVRQFFDGDLDETYFKKFPVGAFPDLRFCGLLGK